MSPIELSGGGGLGPSQDSTLPSLPRPHGEIKGRGTIVKLERIQGITEPGILVRPFTFQVPPLNAFEINRSYPKQTYDTIALGQRIRRGVTQLMTISYDTVFCDDPWSWTLLHGQGFVPDPLEMIATLKEIADAQAEFWLTVRNPTYRSGYDVNWAAYLTNLNSQEKEGEPDARYVTVGFTEFKDSSLKTRVLPGSKGTRNSNLPVTLQCNQLPAGRNTLYQLATFYYGSASEWRRIEKANSLTRTPSYDLRQLGTRKITIPKKP